MLLPSVASLADLDINLGGYGVVEAAGITAPKIDPVPIGATEVSGKGLIKIGQRSKKKAVCTIIVTVKDANDVVKETQTFTIQPTEKDPKGSVWSVTLTNPVQEGYKVYAKQELKGNETETSEEVSVVVKQLLSKSYEGKLNMPEITVKSEDLNTIEADAVKDIVTAFIDENNKLANVDDKNFEKNLYVNKGGSDKKQGLSVAGDGKKITVMFSDESSIELDISNKVTVEKITEVSNAPIINDLKIADGKLTGKVEITKGSVPERTRVKLVKFGPDGPGNGFCNENGCTFDKNSGELAEAKINVKTGEFSFDLADDTLELGKDIGVIVKEYQKKNNCSTTKPTLAIPEVDVRDPKKLTNEEKKAIDEAIRKANTRENGKSKMPDGTGFNSDIKAYIDIDEQGNIKVYDGNDIKGSIVDGVFVPEKDKDGVIQTKSGNSDKVITAEPKDVLNNLPPKQPEVKLSEDKKKITITPNEADTDAKEVNVTYTGKDGSDKKTVAKKDKNGTWTISEGEGTVDANGVITLPTDKIKGETKVNATVKDDGFKEAQQKAEESKNGTLPVPKVKTKAEQVTELGGLDPVNMKKWVGDSLEWKDGVKAKDSASEENKKKIDDFLKEAKTSFADESSRGTTTQGDYKGKIKVTFDDDSFIEVADQTLYVSNHVTSVDRKDKVPTDALDVEFKLGEGTKVDNTGSGAIEGNKENPTSYSKYKVKPGTNLKDYQIPVINSSVVDSIKLKAQEGYADPVWNGQDTTNPKNFVASDTNKVFTATATKAYKVILEANGGKGSMEGSYVKPGNKYKLPTNTFDPPTDGQAFAGWLVGTDPDVKEAGSEINITGDTVIKASWKFTASIKAPNVSADTNTGNLIITPPTPPAGQEIKSVTVKYQDSTGAERTLVAEKSADRWSFVPEAANGENVDESSGVITIPKGNYKPGESVKAHANNQIDQKSEEADATPLEIKFNVNGGSKDVESKITIKGENYVLPAIYDLPEYILTMPEGKEFDGWEIDGVKRKAGESVKIDKNTELKALWRDKGTSPSLPEAPSPEEYEIPGIKIRDHYTPTFPVYVTVPKTEKVEKAEEVPVSLETHKAYIAGYEDSTLRAEGNLTRAEAAAMVTRLAGLDLSDTSMPAFKDMQKNAWYFRYINAAVKAKMLDADNGMMRPNDKITRAEFAKMLAAIDKENSSVSKFDDIKGHRYEKEINKIYGNNRIEGYEDGSFRPDAYLTRAESAAFLNRMFNRIADKEAYAGLEDKLAKFKDFDASKWYYDEMVEATNSHELTRRGKASDKYGRVYEKWTRILPSDVK